MGSGVGPSKRTLVIARVDQSGLLAWLRVWFQARSIMCLLQGSDTGMLNSDVTIDQGMSYLFFGYNDLSLAHYFRQFGSCFRYWIPDRYSSNRCPTLWQKGWIQAKLNSSFHVSIITFSLFPFLDALPNSSFLASSESMDNPPSS
ncbi:hypothetical protein Tco_0161463 [Tanacetum coccineum]